MFGEPLESPQNERSQFNPKSIYGISKISSYYLLKNYRDKKGFFTCTGIMYNHESSRRKSEFVTKKIIEMAVKIKLGRAKELELGNIDALRDWGYAPDYMKAAHLIMSQDKPDDYVIATGKLHSVKQFAEMAFGALGLDLAAVSQDKQHILPGFGSATFMWRCKQTPFTGLGAFQVAARGYYPDGRRRNDHSNEQTVIMNIFFFGYSVKKMQVVPNGTVIIY